MLLYKSHCHWLLEGTKGPKVHICILRNYLKVNLGQVQHLVTALPSEFMILGQYIGSEVRSTAVNVSFHQFTCKPYFHGPISAAPMTSHVFKAF